MGVLPVRRDHVAAAAYRETARKVAAATAAARACRRHLRQLGATHAAGELAAVVRRLDEAGDLLHAGTGSMASEAAAAEAAIHDGRRP